MEEERKQKKGTGTSVSKTRAVQEQKRKQQKELEVTQESVNKEKKTEGQRNCEHNDLEDHLLDEESNLIPGRRKDGQVENKQQKPARVEETAEEEDRNLKHQTQPTSSEEEKRKDLVSENGQLKAELQNVRREYREVRQRYDKLKQRLRNERKVLRKYRRLLIGAFETENLAVFREESSGDPQSLSAPSESPLEEANSEKRRYDLDDFATVDPLRTDVELEREKELDPFEDNMDHQQSPDDSLNYESEKQYREIDKGVDLGPASASAAAAAAATTTTTAGHGQGTAAAASAAAVASCSVEQSADNIKNKRKRDFVSSKDSSWSSESQSSSSTTSKVGLETYQPEEENDKEEEETPSVNWEGDPSRSSYAGNEGVESKRGRHSIWKPEEERLFDEGFHRYGCRWKLIQENLLPNKSRQQIQSHGTYLLRQGRLRKHQGGRHKKTSRDETKKDDKKYSRNEKTMAKSADDESSRPVRQYDVENVA
ncbi:hypothetical protein Gasu2_49440 [Galdieria sulphuraria]|uniref:Myb domain-containing protein n=1 Tax=Galdieria sulphuraria TaxID=130081 RepID=M2Y4D5_GALSU|nr:myb domain-containing protein [Galdieria sulphuraria]EME30699.1 myb domain-containing protein [Galdieria sulphuraria]GJD10774.1 hypothetical protein Gasu2_49440 [Galdieria sulphuraria]|eukprot:XP_005707219.1 myb domain-containing protein [Galdieria sulphuraria]